MNLLKTPQEKLLEEAGMTPASPGMLNTPRQMLYEESGITPNFLANGGQNKLANGGQPQMTPQDMLAALVASGHLPAHFATGGDVQYDEMGNPISGSYIGPEATGKTKFFQTLLHNLAAMPATAGMGAANTGAGIAQYLGYKEPAKALKQITEGISQTAPIGGALGEIGGSMMDPATTGVLKVGSAMKPGAANWLATTGLSGLQGYLSPVENEADRAENAANTVAFNTALLGLGKTGETAKSIYKKLKRK